MKKVGAEDVALEATGELERLEQDYAAVIALLDRGAAFRHATAQARQSLGVDVAMAGEVDDDVDTLVLRTFSGVRTNSLQELVVPPGTGLGGKVAVLRHPIWVPDYCASPAITHDFDLYVRNEQLQGMLAVPILRGHEFHGVLYVGNRQRCAFGDRASDTLLQIARQAGLAIDIAGRSQEMADIAVEEERSRIALSLHDTVGAMLFGISAAAKDLTTNVQADHPLRRRVEFIEQQAVRAAVALRAALRALDETPREVALAVALKRDCSAFQTRTGIRTKVVTLGDVGAIDAGRKSALLSAMREALLNVEKHANAKSVVVSLVRTDDGIAVVVADDGVGIPAEHQRTAGLGLKATAERMAQVGGRMMIAPGDEAGGTVMRAWAPV
ncbi:MAG: GAF domain-containing protein [Actinomycetota bacterium]